MFERIGNVSVQVGSERAWLLRECNPVRQAQSGLPQHIYGVTAGSSGLWTEMESCGGVGA